MGPLALSILGATAGTAISQLPNIIPSKFEREQKKRMEALQRKEEMGLLGLTDKERGVLEGRLESKSMAAADFSAQERQRALAGMGAGVAGQSLLSAQVSDEQLRAQNAAVSHPCFLQRQHLVPHFLRYDVLVMSSSFFRCFP